MTRNLWRCKASFTKKLIGMRILNVLLITLLFQPVFINSLADGKSKRQKGKKADVDISYSLLNARGQQVNVFKEGEDIIFSFTLVNNSGDSLFMDNSFLTDASGFCAVYSQDDKLIGKPFAFSGSQVVTSDAHPFFGNERKYVLTIPWNDSRSFWSTLHHNFRGLNQNALPKGKYYTAFKHRFCFDRTSERPSLCTDMIDIRIDFEVN